MQSTEMNTLNMDSEKVSIMWSLRDLEINFEIEIDFEIMRLRRDIILIK